jgi:aminopeptidase N
MRLDHLLVLAISFTVFSTVSAENNFNFATTPGKLPKQVRPETYAIRIAPDLQKLTFTGSETVKLDVQKPATKLVLNALDLAITAASVDGKPLDTAAIKLDPKEETLTLALPAEISAGAHKLLLNFNGKINAQGQGLFFARYQEEGSGAKKTMLGTQFEATDARRMFPCWDEPSFRARFQLTTVVPENFMAVSNMPVEREEKVAGGKEVRFSMSPSMSSYLVVLVAGELDSIEMESNGVQLRVVATKGKAETGRYALESEAKILRYYNDYFGIPYPLPKLDLIAIPGGFGGAMENWGGITYYESRLLFDPNKSSATNQQDIFAVIAHEMAHMWFGDLVTMAWWDNLWLNEGFASWMGTKCTDHFNPEWNEWQRHNVPRDPTRRIGYSKDMAMKSDARSTTHPIQQPIANEAEANSAFDDITYRKGQAFIRMIESFLGEDIFRDGIRKYMAEHKYSNTTTADLWAALTKVSGKPIAKIAADWTERPGFPLVKIERARGKVKLLQERFAVHFQSSPRQNWRIPITYAVQGDDTTASFLMTGKNAELPNEIPGHRTVKMNTSDGGYYRVDYDPASWRLVEKELSTLSEADRVNLLSDAWALVEANRKPLGHYFDLLEKLSDRDELAVINVAVDNFDFINGLLAGTPEREKFQQYARSVLQPAFDRVGWEAKAGEPVKAGFLRDVLIRGLGKLNDAGVITGCRARFVRLLTDPAAVSPDLRPAIFAVVGRYADADTWEKLHGFGLKTTSIEEKQNYYEALGSALDPKLMQRTLQISLSDELPTSRASYLVPFVAREGERADIVWDFAKANMKALLAKQDALGVNSYAAGLFNFFSDAKDEAELEAYAKSDLPPASAIHVARAIDEIGFRAELKQRLISQFSAWVKEHGKLPR